MRCGCGPTFPLGSAGGMVKAVAPASAPVANVPEGLLGPTVEAFWSPVPAVMSIDPRIVVPPVTPDPASELAIWLIWFHRVWRPTSNKAHRSGPSTNWRRVIPMAVLLVRRRWVGPRHPVPRQDRRLHHRRVLLPVVPTVHGREHGLLRIVPQLREQLEFAPRHHHPALEEQPLPIVEILVDRRQCIPWRSRVRQNGHGIPPD